MSKIILITGCSTGIGRTLAGRLGQAGYTVVATARNVKTLADLRWREKTAGCPGRTPIRKRLDKLSNVGRIDVLVNNSDYFKKLRLTRHRCSI